MIPLGGLLSPIEDPLSDVLVWIHTSIGLSWGWAIIALTIVIRLILLPLTLKQIRSMQRLQRYTPELKALQKKHKEDKQKLNEEVMKFYREKKVNPAASCLPIVVQIPIFIALFFVLRDFNSEVIQPRFPDSDLSFIYIVPNITQDIGTHWAGILLLTIYVISQIASTFFMAATMDKRQRMLFMALPFIFIPFIIRFPVGLMLYWVTTNLWTTGQGLITRRVAPKPAEVPEKRSSRTLSAEEEARNAQREAGSQSRKKKKTKTRVAGTAAAAAEDDEDAEEHPADEEALSDEESPPGDTATAAEPDEDVAMAAPASGPQKKVGKNEPTKKSKSGQKPAPKAGQVRRRKKRGPKGGSKTRR